MSSPRPTSFIVHCMFCRLRISNNTRFLWSRTIRLHVISNFLYESHSDARVPFYGNVSNVFVLFTRTHMTMWRAPHHHLVDSFARPHFVNSSSPFAFTLAHGLLRTRSSCVRNGWKRRDACKAECDEGSIETISINPHSSVGFVLLTVNVVNFVLKVHLEIKSNGSCIDHWIHIKIIEIENNESRAFCFPVVSVQVKSIWWLTISQFKFRKKNPNS